MGHKGYSIFKRKGRGAFYVAWTDGTGKRCVQRASDNRTIANEVGRAKAIEADRVRSGAISPSHAKAAAAGREPSEPHVDAWKAAMLAKKRTARYANMQAHRVKQIMKLAAIGTLDQVAAEKIQRALSTIADQHTTNTANHYRTAMAAFCRWCVLTDRMTGTPMPAVSRLSQAGDTFRRFAFSAEQLERLYVATESRKANTPVSGIDRAMYYRIMANTGFRRNEAASLTPESFDLDNREQPTITIEAAYSKRRRRDTQPINRDFAELVRPWLATKAKGKRIFEFSKWMGIERVFRADCKAAGIEPAEGEILGVHSLRRFYITSVVRGAGLAVGQDLARHSTPALTKKYADMTIDDYRKGLAALPTVAKKIEQKRIG
jgi:integrase